MKEDSQYRFNNSRAYKKLMCMTIALIIIAILSLLYATLVIPSYNYELYRDDVVDISIPRKYRNVVTVDASDTDDWMHQVVALYYKPAQEFSKDFGLILSVKRCNQGQMESILENGGDGVRTMANDGNYWYFVYEPTDVQWRTPEEGVKYQQVCNEIMVSFGALQVAMPNER